MDLIDVTMTSFFGKIRKKWQLLVYVSLILGAVTFFVSTLIPPKYRSDITILVVQHNIDTFFASRSAEYLGEVFSQVLYTESFSSDVLASPLGIEKKFSSDPKKKKKQWEREISVNKISNTGILQVSVFDTSRIQAEKIAGGVGWNFVTNGNKYYGEAEDIGVKIIDGPITTSKPVHPNVFVNALFGFLAGLFGSLMLIYFFDKFDLKVFNLRQVDPSIVGREIQRQLKKRSQKAEFKYPYDECDVYQIEKTAKRVDREDDQALDGGKEKIVTKPADLEAEMELSEEIAFKEQMSQAAIEQTEKSRAETKPVVPAKEVGKRPNFLVRLYQKSLFDDKLFLKKKKKIIEKEHKEQRKRDSAQDEVIEHVKKLNYVEDKSDQMPWMGGSRTAPAPDNLPIFMQADETLKNAQAGSESKDEIESKPSQAEPELKNKRKISTAKKIKTNSDEAIKKDKEKNEQEPSNDEVKDRLNKLLKGEL